MKAIKEIFFQDFFISRPPLWRILTLYKKLNKIILLWGEKTYKIGTIHVSIIFECNGVSKGVKHSKMEMRDVCMKGMRKMANEKKKK